MATTVIHGEKEAVLVDPPLTKDQANDLAKWIKAVIPNKALTTIHITNGHGDHYFAVAPLLEHFPHAQAVATPATIEHMAQQEEPEFYA
jgi:glyoxylase-like metal-dependent hydrolase (beta-lactamase superfamily II)